MGKNFSIWAGLFASGITLMTVIAAVRMSAVADTETGRSGEDFEPSALTPTDQAPDQPGVQTNQ